MSSCVSGRMSARRMSPCRRIIGGWPTLRCRSDASCFMTMRNSLLTSGSRTLAASAGSFIGTCSWSGMSAVAIVEPPRVSRLRPGERSPESAAKRFAPARRARPGSAWSRGCRIHCNEKCWRPGPRRRRPRTPGTGAPDSRPRRWPPRGCAPPRPTAARHRQIVAGLGAVGVHRGQHDLAGAQLLDALRPGHRLQAGRHPAAVDVDLPPFLGIEVRGRDQRSTQRTRRCSDF